eukprot:111181-Amorphochlora_amoeboformis.AAC.2
MLGRAHTGGMGKADVLLQEHRRAMAAKQLWIWAASCMFHFLVWFWHWQNKRVVLHRGHKKAVKGEPTNRGVHYIRLAALVRELVPDIFRAALPSQEHDWTEGSKL